MISRMAITAIIATASLHAFGAAPVTVLSSNGRMVQYVSQIESSGDSPLRIVPGEVFIGERVVKHENGECFKEVAHLAAMKTYEAQGVSLQLPEMQGSKSRVPCPAGALGMPGAKR